MIEAVIVDLDDTLYPQASFLSSAWDEVASAGVLLGIDRLEFRGALAAIAVEGSDRGHIIDRALDLIGASPVFASSLVQVFRDFRPARLAPYAGVAARLELLHARVRLAVLTDGHALQQRAKLDATGLAGVFDVVVCTDDAGREYRKPHPHGFVAALEGLGTTAATTVMIGDRPSKDVAGAVALGLRAIRVRQGEHSAAPSMPVPWCEVPTTAMALDIVLASLPVVA